MVQVSIIQLFRNKKRSYFKIPGSNVPKYFNWKLSSLVKFLFLLCYYFSYLSLRYFLHPRFPDHYWFTDYHVQIIIRHPWLLVIFLHPTNYFGINRSRKEESFKDSSTKNSHSISISSIPVKVLLNSKDEWIPGFIRVQNDCSASRQKLKKYY